MRLKTLEDVFAYAEAEGIELRLDGAETQVRRPQASRPGRRAFVSGKRKQNTIKSTTFSDGQGRMLLAGVIRPGRMHDQTAVRTEGIAEQFRLRPRVKAKVDSGYAELAKEFPDQVSAPPKKPKDETCDGERRAWREGRRRQSSARICVEHTNAELRQWAPLRRFTGRRETYAETHRTAGSALLTTRTCGRPRCSMRWWGSAMRVRTRRSPGRFAAIASGRTASLAMPRPAATSR
ncbi:transposase family protein [Streptomyces sp. NPDC096153]|uniref:transposase family protein n=1 Tax=Streptomyces sp. NPDC096153 TaxID=3155548 RepID=UPI00331F05DA